MTFHDSLRDLFQSNAIYYGEIFIVALIMIIVMAHDRD